MRQIQKLKVLLLVGFLGSLLIIVNSTFNSCSAVNFSGAQFTKVADDSEEGAVNANGNQNDNSCTGPQCPNSPCDNNNCDQSKNKIPVSYNIEYTVPKTLSKLDILMVLDNSGSMKQDNKKLADRLENLIDVLKDSEIDWQMCYTLTEVENPSGKVKNNAGDLKDWFKKIEHGKGHGKDKYKSTNSKILRGDTKNVKRIFSDTLETIDDKKGSSNEQAIAAVRYTLKNSDNDKCFRHDAALALITLSDEDEKSCGGRCKNGPDEQKPFAGRSITRYTNQYRHLTSMNDPQNLTQAVQLKWPNKVFTAHSLSIMKDDKSCYDEQDRANPAFYGYTYQNLSDITDGTKGSICAEDYAAQLTHVGKRTVEALQSLPLKCAPNEVTAISIEPNSSMSIAKVSGDKVYFDPPLPEGTKVTVKYVCLEEKK